MSRFLCASLLGLLALSFTTAARENSARPQPPVFSKLPALTQFVKDSMDKMHVPGVAVGVVYRDQVIYLQGFGVRSVEAADPVTADTVFHLASVSKPIASTVVATAVGDGFVDWDDRVAELDPTFHLSDPEVEAQLTIRDLLSHRSGLPESAGDVLEELGFSRPEILSRMRLLPFSGKFRQTYTYSNFPYTEGALAGVSRTRQVWEAYAERRLFRRLGMTSTSYRSSDFDNRSDKAAMHVLIGNQAKARYRREPDSEAPAGGATSNVHDMVQLLRLHLSGGRVDGDQVVASRALAETHKQQIVIGINETTRGPAYYGLGWNVDYDADGNLLLSHSGAFRTGTGTTLMLQPSLQLGIVVLTNAQPTGLAEAVTHHFFDLVKLGSPQKDWLQFYGDIFKQAIAASDSAPTDYAHIEPPASPVSPQPSSAYIGHYQNSYYGVIEVFAERGQLYLRLPARSTIYALQHWDGDLFTFRYEAESGISVHGLTFRYQGGDQLQIDNLATEGNGVFTRVQ